MGSYRGAIFLLALMLILLSCVNKDPDVTIEMEFPTELPSTFHRPKLSEQLYFPIIKKDGVRFGLAYGAWKNGHLDNNVAVHAHALGLEGDYRWHNWSLFGSEVADFVPFVYSPDYVGSFCKKEYTGDVIFANECDLAEQCNATTGQVVQMALDMLECNPDITLIGPAYSADDYGQLSLEFYEGYISEGGDPNKLEPSLHLYPYALGDASKRVDRYFSFYLTPTEQTHKRIHVTEIGWQACYDRATFLQWVNKLSRDVRIDTLYGYSPRTPYPEICDFVPFVVNGRATDVGFIFGRNATRRAYP